jgi:hypothetical protein
MRVSRLELHMAFILPLRHSHYALKVTTLSNETLAKQKHTYYTTLFLFFVVTIASKDLIQHKPDNIPLVFKKWKRH